MDEEEDTGWDENKPLGHSAFYTLNTVIIHAR